MRKYFGMAVGLVALCAVVAQPAFGACGAQGDLVTSGGEFGVSSVYSNPNWCGPTATFCSNVGPALSPATRAFFWDLGFGNQTPGPGNDNGNFGGGFSDTGPATCSGNQWVCANFTGGSGFYGAGLLVGGWSSSNQVDGCGVAAFPATKCSCVLITDQWSGVGYYLIAGAAHDPTGTFDFTQPGGAPLELVPIPKPGITGSQRLQPSLDVVLNTRIPAPAAGVYLKDGCNCAPTGYKILQQILPEMSPAPTDRALTAGWTEPNREDGSPQPANGSPFGTGMGQGVNVRSACGMSDTDVYLATQLIFPDGYRATILSENSTRVECGPNLATPAPDRPERPERNNTGRVPIGRSGR
jgi:hypothetical protein